jgi:hypothetical protein
MERLAKFLLFLGLLMILVGVVVAFMGY